MQSSTGVVTLPSPGGFDDTLNRLRTTIAARGLRLFLDLDQQAAAREDGVSMPAAHLLLFGRPRAGTPALRESPESGVDLPLKVFVWESEEGKVFVSYSDPAFIAKRHHLTEGVARPLAGITDLISSALR